MQIANSQKVAVLNPSLVTAGLSFIAGILALYFYFATKSDKSGFAWVGLLSVLQLTPFILGLVLRSQNYLNFILLSHFAGFSLAKWNEAQYLSKAHALSQSWVNATHELTICTLLIGVSYYVARTIFIPEELRRRQFNELTLNAFQLRVIFIYILMFPVMNFFMPAGLLIIHFALSNAQMLLLICAQSTANKRFLSWAKGAIPLVGFVNFLISGFLTMLGQYASFLIVYGLIRGKVRFILPTLVLTLCLSAIQSVKNDFRLYKSAAPESSLFEQLQTLTALLERKYFSDGTEEEVSEEKDTAQTNLIQGFSRIGDDSLERVLAMTPSQVPFWNGETYESIPYMFIPRFLWPEKPGRHFWNKFGRAYHVLSSDDALTSVGVGFFAEAYMNFGFWWMYLLASIMGFFVCAVERLSMTLLKDKFYFPYIAFLGPIIGLGADLGSIVNSTMILTCCMFVARPFLLRLAQRDDYS